MKLAVAATDELTPARRLADQVGVILTARGHQFTELSGDAELVLNVTSRQSAHVNYVRPNASVFVASLMHTPDGDQWPDADALKRDTYAVLIKTLSNIVIHQVDGGRHGGSAYFMTPELGFRSAPCDAALPAAIADYVAPLAAARLVIENRLVPDLPEALWNGDEHSRALADHGRKLAAMKLLPSVFDIAQMLDERERRLAMKIFGLKQLSYGNLSCRRDASSFWMSGRGVDKGNLLRIGHDMLLVTGYDAATQTILLSVPPAHDPSARVSVDAIEHFKLYQAVPEIGAIVHVHAWLPGTAATLQSWPCGSEQLADEVLSLALAAPDPSRAVVGLKNHGVTITGRSLVEIFERIDGRLQQEIPAL